MANSARKFVSMTGYSGGYTSRTMEPTHPAHISNQTRGIIQVFITSGTVSLYARVHGDAPWFLLKVYSASEMEEIVLANQLRIVATDTAECWLGEVL